MPTPLLTTGTVNEVSAHVSGDIGGVGISRFRFIRNDAGVTTVADCNAAGAAVRALLFAITGWPTGVTWAISPTVELFQIDTALVQGAITMTTVPSNVVGSAGTACAAGVGARINWKTATISGRRLLKGSSYMVPLHSSSYSGTGAVSGTALTQLANAGTAYIAAMTAANLVPVIWHRPLKGTTSGGLVGPVNAVQVPTTPAGLRSRRS